MNHFESNPSQAAQISLASWAAEVAKGDSSTKDADNKESYCIDSSQTRERQSDIFFKTHIFKRRQA